MVDVDGLGDHGVELQDLERDAHGLARHLGGVAVTPVVGVQEPQQLDLGPAADVGVAQAGVADRRAVEQDRPGPEAPALPVAEEVVEERVRAVGGPQVLGPRLLGDASVGEDPCVGGGVAGLGAAADEAGGGDAIDPEVDGHGRGHSAGIEYVYIRSASMRAKSGPESMNSSHSAP